MADVPLVVVSENSSSERRITPSWSISTLKAKLETITGIPPSAQRILLKTAAEGSIPIEASDEDSTDLSAFRLTAYAELQVSVSLKFVGYPSLSATCWLFPSARNQIPRHESQAPKALSKGMFFPKWEPYGQATWFSKRCRSSSSHYRGLMIRTTSECPCAVPLDAIVKSTVIPHMLQMLDRNLENGDQASTIKKNVADSDTGYRHTTSWGQAKLHRC